MLRKLWRDHSILFPFLFLFLNAVDKGMGQWTKHASQKSEFSPWLCGDGLRSRHWPLWVSISSSVKWGGGTCLPGGPPVPSRTSASTWEKLPGGKVNLSGRKEVSFKIKVTFLLTKRIFMQKAFQMTLKQSRNESETPNVCFFSTF